MTLDKSFYLSERFFLRRLSKCLHWPHGVSLLPSPLEEGGGQRLGADSRVGLPRGRRLRPGMLACAEGSVGGRLLCSLIPPEKEEAVV